MGAFTLDSILCGFDGPRAYDPFGIVLLKPCFRVRSGNPEVIGFSLSDAITFRVFSLSHLPARLLLLEQPLAFDLITVRECPQAALAASPLITSTPDIRRLPRHVCFAPDSDLKVSLQGKGPSLISATSFPARSQTALGRHRKLPFCDKRQLHRGLRQLLVGWHPFFSRRR
jgi:hypothetical protein